MSETTFLITLEMLYISNETSLFMSKFLHPKNALFRNRLSSNHACGEKQRLF